MDSHKKMKNYDRVMSRVFSRSRSSLRSGSNVTRHEVPSSVRVGAKPSVSAVSSGVFSELPTVLNDYVPDVGRDKVSKRTVVKPRRTLKSLDVSKMKSPQRTSRERAMEYDRSIRARGSAPVLSSNGEEWAESHVRQCYSSRSHTRLKELKDEIKAFNETDKLMKLRSHLYARCGVVLDDMGHVQRDQGVQASPEPDKENTSIRSTMSSSQPITVEKQSSDIMLPNFYTQPIELNDPFNYSQEIDDYLKYQDKFLNPVQNVSGQGAQKKTDKSTKKKTLKRKTEIDNIGLNSHFIKKVKKGKRLIKIKISNLDSNSGPDEVMVQFVVEDTYDELLNATERLVEKIVKRLSEVTSD